MEHFKVVCSVTSEAIGDLVLIHTSLLMLCKSSGSNWLIVYEELSQSDCSVCTSILVEFY